MGTPKAVAPDSSLPSPDSALFGPRGKLVKYAGSWNGGLFTYGANVLTDGERFMVGEQQWEIDYNRTSSAGLDNFTGDYLPSSSFVAITAVPEPGTFVLLGIGLAGLLLARRRG